MKSINRSNFHRAVNGHAKIDHTCVLIYVHKMGMQIEATVHTQTLSDDLRCFYSDTLGHIYGMDKLDYSFHVY